MENSPKRSRAADVAVTLALMATFVAASLTLSPTSSPIGPANGPGQLAFDDDGQALAPAPAGTIGSSSTPSAGTDALGVLTPQGEAGTSGAAGSPLAPPNNSTSPNTQAPSNSTPLDQAAGVSPAPAAPLGDVDEGVSTTPATYPTQSITEEAAKPALTPPPVPGGAPAPIAGEWPMDWGFDPGVQSRISLRQPETTVNAAEFGVIADDGLDDHAGIAAALGSLGTSGGRVVLPAGALQTSKTINLSSRQVLSGSGSYETTIIFTADGVWGVELGGDYPKASGTVQNGPAGSTQLTVTITDAPKAGQLALLTGGSASSDSAGQMVWINAVEQSGSSWLVSVAEPLAQDLTGAEFSPFNPGVGIGLENLNLKPAVGVSVDYHVVLRGTANSWITNVRSEFAKRSHVYTRQTYRCEVRDSSFVEALDKGDGGNGYGLNIANNTTGCLFMQNRLSLLRHSILLHGGATGNVVAYNTSTEPRHTNFTNGGPADMSFHGYSVGNLVEGNVLERTQLTDAGSAGSNNSIVRNCFTSGPITLQNNPTNVKISGNTILGSNAQLTQTQMPAVQGSAPRAYTKSDLFDDDGILLLSEAPGLQAEGNWFNGSAQGTSPLSAFAVVTLTPTTPTGNAKTDCPYAP